MPPGLNVPILAYHQVQPVQRPPPKNASLLVDAARFQRQIFLLRVLGYRSMRLAELAEALTNGRSLPRNSIVITFDDGYMGAYDHAFPVLKRHGFRATVFLIAEDFMSNHRSPAARAFPIMTRAQVAALITQGFELGSHTLTHPDLIGLSEAEIQTELGQSRQILAAAFGVAVTALAYPGGHTSAAIERIAAEVGYRAAVTTELGRVRGSTRPMAMKRIAVGYTHSAARFLYRVMLKPLN